MILLWLEQGGWALALLAMLLTIIADRQLVCRPGRCPSDCPERKWCVLQ